MAHLPTCDPPCMDAPLCQCRGELETCPICGATGPCYLDDQGRPLVHSDAFPDTAQVTP